MVIYFLSRGKGMATYFLSRAKGTVTYFFSEAKGMVTYFLSRGKGMVTYVLSRRKGMVTYFYVYLQNDEALWQQCTEPILERQTLNSVCGPYHTSLPASYLLLLSPTVFPFLAVRQL